MPYFEVAEFREAMPDMENQTYSDDQIERARDWIEAVIEEACGTSFIVREDVAETLNGSGHTGLVLSSSYVRAINSVTLNGTALTGYTYSYTFGVLQRCATGSFTPVPWDCGVGNVVVNYDSGYSDECPTDLKYAAMQAARDRVLQWSGRVDGPSARATAATNEYGTISYTVASADAPTGLPEVDATIQRYVRRVNGPGVG